MARQGKGVLPLQDALQPSQRAATGVMPWGVQLTIMKPLEQPAVRAETSSAMWPQRQLKQLIAARLGRHSAKSNAPCCATAGCPCAAITGCGKRSGS